MKYVITLLLTMLIAVGMCGCEFSADSNYYSVTPYSPEGQTINLEQTVVSDYSELRDALVSLVEDGIQSGVIHTIGIEMQQLDYFMSTAIWYARNNTSIGAYAVNKITYEIGTNAGLPALSVNISYYRNRSEILRIKTTNHMEEVEKLVIRALENCDAGVVLRVTDYKEVDLTQVVETYVDENPGICVEMPQVNVVQHPERGKDRVLEISFVYQTSRETLRSMQDAVRNIFSSAELYVLGDAQNWEKYSHLYSFLMERHDYKIETSITPAYSLLRHGVGDSEAFARVFASMCQQVDLNCDVVTGTKDGTPWFWNLIMEDGTYYHVDLVESLHQREFYPMLSREMQGYVWDYSAYDMDPETIYTPDPTEPDSGEEPTQPSEGGDPTEPSETQESTEPSETQESTEPSESEASTQAMEMTQPSEATIPEQTESQEESESDA